MSDRERILSVTKDDCRWEYMPAGKNGGQNGNKNSTAVRVTHPPSGARGESREFKSQLQNRHAAWKRMVESKEFDLWIKKMTGQLAAADAESKRRIQLQLERDLHPDNIKIQYYTPKGDE